MSHTFIQFYYHFIWRTKNSEPYLTPEVERIVYGYIKKRSEELGVFIYALNGIEDHSHLVCSVPARIAVSEFVEKIKGASSHYVNHLEELANNLYWQAGYGGLTFARKDLPRVVDYVTNQKSHHAEGTLWESLEATEAPTSSGAPE